MAGLAAIAALALPAAAGAQGRWMPPKPLTGESAVIPQVTLGPSGEGLAAWMARGADQGRGGGNVSVAVRPPGGVFGEARALVPGPAHFSGLVANGSGDTTLLYRDPAPGLSLHAAFRPALGEFAPPLDVGTGGGPAGIDAAGNITFVQLVDEKEPPDNLKHVAHRITAITRAPGGTLGPVREIMRNELIHGEAIGVDPAGNTTVAWRARVPGDDEATQPYAAVSPPGGAFSEPIALGPPTPDNQGSGPMRVVTSAAGTLVAWPAQPPNPSPGVPYKTVNHRLHSSFRPPGGQFGPVEQIPLDDPQAETLLRWDVAMSRTGDVVAAWGATAISLSYRPLGGQWEESRPATHYPRIGGDSFDGQSSPVVAFDGKGTAIVAYVSRMGTKDAKGRWRDGPARLMAMRRPRGGRFGTPEAVVTAKNIFTPSLAGDPLGNAILVWSHEEIGSWDAERTEEGIGSAIWDAREPSVTGFGVDPGTAAFEFRLSEAASVTVQVDRLAARRTERLAKVKFRAGRGTGERAIEKPLAKRLRRSGSYRATVVARDSAGRRSKARRVGFGPLDR